MKGRYFIRESVYICGDYMDAEVYPVFQPAGKRRKRCKPTSEIQEKTNQRNAEKRLTRLVHANFTGADLALHLTYRLSPESVEEAKRDLQNFLRRVKRLREKLGLSPIKYIYRTEEGGRGGRIHHHIILNGGVDRDELEKLWGKGLANSKRLQFGEDGIKGLAIYMAKERITYRRWHGSRNLIKPQPEVRDGFLSRVDTADMADAIEGKRAWQYFEEKYPGFILTDADFVKNDVNYGIYIRVEMRRAENYDAVIRERGREVFFDSKAG